MLAALPGQVSLLVDGAFLASPGLLVGAVVALSRILVIVLTAPASRRRRASRASARA